MEFFPDGTHMRLRSRPTGGYLHADKDGAGVSLRPRARASLNAAWRVQRAARYGGAYVLLQGAAYGRYVALSPSPGPGRRAVVQLDYDAPGMDAAIMWKAARAVGGGAGADDVLLRHFPACYRRLRADGRCRVWRAGVTVDEHGGRSTMMQWTVEVIPPMPAPRLLPVPGPLLFPQHQCSIPLQQNLGGLLCRQQRTIRYVWADDHGRFDELGWATFEFCGRSLFNLRAEVAHRAGKEISSGMTVCVRPGFYGRLTPLVIDLPRSEDPMDIVVLTTWSPANEELRYPDVDAPKGT
ncbi:hypothetical protein BS78_10G051700 [Paspalum vaginatum]|nr:hypothetical protein BS78_10G051700 [Paspalum vaginatum]